MHVGTMTSRDHAVGIHVLRPPGYPHSQSNGRVKPSVHLRITVFDHVLLSFGPVLLSFGHCLALFGTV